MADHSSMKRSLYCSFHPDHLHSTRTTQNHPHTSTYLQSTKSVLIRSSLHPLDSSTKLPPATFDHCVYRFLPALQLETNENCFIASIQHKHTHSCCCVFFFVQQYIWFFLAGILIKRFFLMNRQKPQFFFQNVMNYLQVRRFNSRYRNKSVTPSDAAPQNRRPREHVNASFRQTECVIHPQSLCQLSMFYSKQ